MRRVMALFLLLLSVHTHAQSVKGKLFGKNKGDKEILPGGMVRWIGTNIAVIVNENGVFDLPLKGITDRRIIATNIGYVSDTVDAKGKTYVSILLERDANELDAVTVTDRSGAYMSRLEVGQTEVINQRELTKAACCDLAGCFGTQASVQPQTTNVVTNAKELRILGLSGVYNQVLTDGLPMILGSSYTYGISTYPGTMVNKVMVAKGTTSVLQGFESISGQINIVTRDPDMADKLFLNAYINSFGEKQLNANVAAKVGKNKKWRTLLALHTVQPAGKIDGNNDGFLDLPQLTRYMAYNRWQYGAPDKRGFSTQIGLRLTDERRTGGQIGYNDATDKGSATVYGQSVQFTQPEAYAKSTYRFSDDHALVFSVSGQKHDQKSWFGTTKYTAKQELLSLNLQHEWLWQDKHLLKYGASYRYQELNEHVGFITNDLNKTYAGDYRTYLRVPGVFAENAFHWDKDKFVLITGARIDKHQKWGAFFTPRGMLKYNIDDHNTLRASAGSGWRQVNLFAEQINILVSSRDAVFAETLKPEQAFNWGLSHQYRFEFGATTGTLSGDFYSTRFSNQFFPDYYADPTKVVIRNFEGVSRSNGLQLEAAFQFFRQLELRAAYNYLNVYRIESGEKVRLPFNPFNRAMAAASFHTLNDRWQFDVNTHWFDKMKLPDTHTNPEQYRRPLYSTPYLTLNLQATFRWKRWDVYAGCENIANYRQPKPIISADNPFGQYFDLSSVWGPTRGRELYLGVRYAVK